MKNFLLLLILFALPTFQANAARVTLSTKIVGVGQYSAKTSFHFTAKDKYAKCSHTKKSGTYRVIGSNARAVFSNLLAAATTGARVKLWVSGCTSTGHANVDEVYFYAN